MPQYITRPGGHDVTYPGPYTATDVDLHLYLLNGGYGALLATLDRYVNAVAPPLTRYFPLGDRVVACFAAMDKVVSSDPQLGSMREVDMAFFIPAVRFNGLIPTKIVFFAPYLFVDIPQAAATGREVHGYRKDLATSVSTTDIYAPGWIPNAADLTHIDAWAVSAVGARLQRQRLVDLAKPAPVPPVSWPDADSVIDDLFEELIGGLLALPGELAKVFGNKPGFGSALLKPALKLLFKAFLDKIEVKVPIVFLRQFRNPRSSGQAGEQELVQASTCLRLSDLSGGKLPAGYQITFHDKVSHPFSTELGIPSGAPIGSSLSVHAHCSFTLEDCD